MNPGKLTVLIIITIILTGGAGCDRFEQRNREQPIARVNEEFLFPSDIKDIFPAGLPEQDSLLILRNFTDKWIKKQLILQKAELNLTDQQKDVSRQMEEYRSSLLIFKYEQNLIKQKLDTLITREEIEEYYTVNESNFILDEPIVRALFIKIPVNAPNINRIRSLYRSEDEMDIQQLESYCYQYANKYDSFDGNWIPFDNILRQLSEPLNNPGRRLRYYNYIEQEDSLFRYYVHIRDYRLGSTPAPLPYVEESIKSIILNKRKLQFIQRLENSIYNDALNRGQFTIYEDI